MLSVCCCCCALLKCAAAGWCTYQSLPQPHPTVSPAHLSLISWAQVRLVAPNDLARAAIEAHAKISRYTLRTPLLHSAWLSAVGECEAFLKLESEQYTNSFKVRGALNKLLALNEQQLAQGLVTSSTGNHALAVLHACSALPAARSVDCTIYLPTTAAAGKVWCGAFVWTLGGAATVRSCRTLIITSLGRTSARQHVPDAAMPYQVAKLRARGARIILHGADCVLAEAEARRVAAQRGCTYVSPYNDTAVMAGQGTLAVELLQQLHDRVLEQQQSLQPQSLPPLQQQQEGVEERLIDVAIIPVGGGGLIAGVAAVLKAAVPGVHVVGASPAASPVMARSAAAGRVLDDVPCDAPTLSDATAGGIEPNAATLQPCMSYVDEWVDVDEAAIADALVSLLEHEGKVAEGAAGVGLAAFVQLASIGSLRGKRVAVVVCGGNIGREALSRVLEQGRVLGKERWCSADSS
jgi:threonine dehydratase